MLVAAQSWVISLRLFFVLIYGVVVFRDSEVFQREERPNVVRICLLI